MALGLVEILFGFVVCAAVAPALAVSAEGHLDRQATRLRPKDRTSGDRAAHRHALRQAGNDLANRRRRRGLRVLTRFAQAHGVGLLDQTGKAAASRKTKEL
jgi:hypothetical protein